ncbi:MAG TPA: methyltransferase domain-containing protein [Longimicrobium sp.]|jgi:SAM-dependent methyltransferase|uniref:methyltransferase domain-containing protein n=1 Tax=Longimicrobium sp. TaxID=2029185 RepID=UPI002ED845C2
MTPDTVPVRDFIQGLLHPAGASSILDVGCGRGEDLRQIAQLTGEDARLVGVDASAANITEAQQRAGDDSRQLYFAHDVSAGLPFEDGEFDRVLSVNLLECIADKQRLLTEVHRVLGPGGRVVFAHWDWDSQLIDGDDKDLIREIVHTFGDWKQAWMADSDAWMGRRLWRTFQESEGFEGAVHPFVLTNTRFEPGTYGHSSVENFRGLVKRGMLAPERYESFYRSLVEMGATNRYFYSITMFVYAGHKRG